MQLENRWGKCHKLSFTALEGGTETKTLYVFTKTQAIFIQFKSRHRGAKKRKNLSLPCRRAKLSNILIYYLTLILLGRDFVVQRKMNV